MVRGRIIQELVASQWPSQACMHRDSVDTVAGVQSPRKMPLAFRDP